MHADSAIVGVVGVKIYVEFKREYMFIQPAINKYTE